MNIQSPDKKPQELPRVLAFIAATGAAALIVLAAATLGWSEERLGPLAVLVALTIASELFDIRLFSQSRVSVTVAAIVAAGTISGLQGASIVALTAAAVDYAVHRKPFYKAVFNASTLVLSGAVYVGVFEQFPVGSDGTEWRQLIFPALAGVLANFVVNSAFVGVVISLDKGISVADVFQRNFMPLLPFYTVLGVLAAIVASAYESDGVIAMIIALAPVVMMRFILKQAIERPPQVLQPAGSPL